LKGKEEEATITPVYRPLQISYSTPQNVRRCIKNCRKVPQFYTLQTENKRNCDDGVTFESTLAEPFSRFDKWG